MVCLHFFSVFVCVFADPPYYAKSPLPSHLHNLICTQTSIFDSLIETNLWKTPTVQVQKCHYALQICTSSQQPLWENNTAIMSNVCLHIQASLIEHTDYEPLSVFIQKHRKHIQRQLLILGKQKSRWTLLSYLNSHTKQHHCTAVQQLTPMQHPSVSSFWEVNWASAILDNCLS